MVSTPDDGPKQRPEERSAEQPAESAGPRAEPWLLGFACLLPTVVTYAYFHAAEGAPPAVQQAVYAVGKAIQFGLPAVWVGLFLRRRLGWVRWTKRGVSLGAAFGVVAGVGGWLLFRFLLRDTPLMTEAAEPILQKVDGLGIGNPPLFLGVGVFYAVCHSLMEEYYWRWFVFRRLGSWVKQPTAIVVSSLAFAAHHVLVLHRYFGDAPLVTAFLSLAVAIGGAFWAWLYRRSDSLLGPWISHLLIDAAIFAIGYEIVIRV